MDTPFNRAQRAADQYNADVVKSRYDDAMALLSDLAEVEVPDTEVSGSYTFNQYIADCLRMIEFVRPLIERAKKGE